jgi:hypothetical protein
MWRDEADGSEVGSESDSGSSHYSGDSTEGMSASDSSDDLSGRRSTADPKDAYTTVAGFDGEAMHNEPWELSGTGPHPPPYTLHGLYDGADERHNTPAWAKLGPAAAPTEMWCPEEVAPQPPATGDLSAPLAMGAGAWDGTGTTSASSVQATSTWVPPELKLEASAPPAAIVPAQWPPPPPPPATAPAAPVPTGAGHYLPTVCPQPKARPFGSSSVVPPPLVCPFCSASPECSVGDDARNGGDEDVDKKRRSRRERKQPRANFKLGQWWKGFGYSGPRYCQRCSEVFRDHLIRQQSNSASCKRTDPCNDCAKVLTHFRDKDPWARIDAREEQNRLKRKQRQSKGGPPSGVKKTRVAVAAMTTLAASLVALVWFHPEYLYLQDPAVTPSLDCAAGLPNVENTAPSPCPSGPVGTVCSYFCLPGHEKPGAGNSTAQHICTGRSLPNLARTPAYIGGVCRPCTDGQWSAGRDDRCKPCTQCSLGYASACSLAADAVCVTPFGPFLTWQDNQQPPHLIDAAAFASPSGEMYMFGGQGPKGIGRKGPEKGEADCEGYQDLLIKHSPPVGIEGVTWEIVHPESPDEAWPEPRAGAMVWQRDEASWFMFGGNRAGVTGMSDLWSFNASASDTPYWTRECPNKNASIKPVSGTTGAFFGGRVLQFGDFKHVCSTTNMDWLPKVAPLTDPDRHDLPIEWKGLPYIGTEGRLDLKQYAAEAPASRWPLPRSFGTITPLPCPPNSPPGCTKNEGWLFGGAVGYDHDSPARSNTTDYQVHEAKCSRAGTCTCVPSSSISEAFPVNDLWHLEWDQSGSGSIDWSYLGPYGPDMDNGGYVNSRGQGDLNTYLTAADSKGVGRARRGFWVSSRSGHAAWAAADGRLFIFGGAGLTMLPRPGWKPSDLQPGEYDARCAMLGDLWIMYPERDNADAQGTEWEDTDHVYGDLSNPFSPSSGWGQNSMWGWSPESSYTPSPYHSACSLGMLQLCAYCENHFRRQMPLEQWPEPYSESSYVPARVNASGAGWRWDSPVGRRAAVAWTDPESQTAWLYGGESFVLDPEYTDDAMLNDLWRIDMAPLEDTDTSTPGLFISHAGDWARPQDTGAGPFLAMKDVHSASGPGAPDGLRMPGRAHAVSWLRQQGSLDEGGGSPWPVVFGGTGARPDMPWNDPEDAVNYKLLPLWQQPSSTDPWATVYLEDVWAFTAPGLPSGQR